MGFDLVKYHNYLETLSETLVVFPWVSVVVPERDD